MKDPKDMTEEKTIRIYLGPDPDAALHSAEREVLEACVRWVAANEQKDEDSTMIALFQAGIRYRALLDGKAEGKEA